jgi:hypothetical protein
MSRLLERAFAEASKLTESEQDALAAWLLEELAADQRWERSFAKSPDALAKLAEEALAEHREHRTKPLDPDTL